MRLILLILLVLFLFNGGAYYGGYYGGYPACGAGTILFVLLLLVLFGVI